MSQCRLGSVVDLYETGKELTSIGAILAFDMTKETIIAKLGYLLGKELPINKIKLLMKTNMKGELTENIKSGINLS